MITAQDCMKIYAEADNKYNEIRRDQATKIVDTIAEQLYDLAKIRKTGMSVSFSPKEIELKCYWEPMLLDLGYKIKWTNYSVAVISYK